MEELIERVNFDEHIEKIVDIEEKMTEVVRKKYPELFGRQDTEHFRRYLSCELQTLSSKSIELYYNNLKKAENEDRNIVKERYDILMQLLKKTTIRR